MYVFRHPQLVLTDDDVTYQGYAPLNSDFDSFYTRRLKKRMEECFSQPVTGVAGRTIQILDRYSKDFNHTQTSLNTVTRALNISSYNYLGFAQARGGCADAVEEGMKIYGVSTCGSRLEGGSSDLHTTTESLVAKFVGTEDALVSSMGFATNSTYIPALVSKGCLVISDEFNHASIRFGVRSSGAQVRMFKHNDTNALEALLREAISQGQPKTHRPWKKILVIVEGIFSMEGTMIDLPTILALKDKYKVCVVFHRTSAHFIMLIESSSFTFLLMRRIPSEGSVYTGGELRTIMPLILGRLMFSWAHSRNLLVQLEDILLGVKFSLTVYEFVVTPVLMRRQWLRQCLLRLSPVWPASWGLITPQVHPWNLLHLLHLALHFSSSHHLHHQRHSIITPALSLKASSLRGLHFLTRFLLDLKAVNASVVSLLIPITSTAALINSVLSRMGIHVRPSFHFSSSILEK